MLLCKLIFSFCFLCIVKCEFYTKENSSAAFEFFKEKYNRKYDTESMEDVALENFVKNLNRVDELNAESKDNTIYILNKYADIDPDEFEQHFAVNISAYNKEKIDEDKVIKHSRQLLEKMEIPIEPRDLDLTMYDLDDAENLYKEYMKRFDKPNATKKYDRTVNFYRFVKSVVYINRNRYNGYKNASLNEESDVVRRPHDFMY